MSASRYRIPDEPTATGSQRVIVDPMWPLLACMFAGFGLAAVWFVVNGMALGSPTRARELAWAAAGFVLAISAVALLIAIDGAPWFPDVAGPYALIGVTCVKLAVCYRLYTFQSTPFELWRHFGGKPAAGVFGLIILVYVGKNLWRSLPKDHLLALALG